MDRSKATATPRGVKHGFDNKDACCRRTRDHPPPLLPRAAQLLPHQRTRSNHTVIQERKVYTPASLILSKHGKRRKVGGGGDCSLARPPFRRIRPTECLINSSDGCGLGYANSQKSKPSGSRMLFPRTTRGHGEKYRHVRDHDHRRLRNQLGRVPWHGGEAPSDEIPYAVADGAPSLLVEVEIALLDISHQLCLDRREQGRRLAPAAAPTPGEGRNPQSHHRSVSSTPTSQAPKTSDPRRCHRTPPEGSLPTKDGPERKSYPARSATNLVRTWTVREVERRPPRDSPGRRQF